MKYDKVIIARFVSRPNRFVAKVEIDHREVEVHVKNTGRCRELLIPGAVVYLEDFTEKMGKRKLAYSLVAAEKSKESGVLLINMDSQAPNKVIGEALREGKLFLPGMGQPENVRAEVTYGDSRLDFFVIDKDGKEGYIEVKGVTLENCGVAAFPDAPTERGVKHLNELSKIARMGRLAYVIFVIQMEGVNCFIPNDVMHKEFGDALREAQRTGVCVLAYQCQVEPGMLLLSEPVRVSL